jgi:riboflavin biosynthesis pyrimidine reductase
MVLLGGANLVSCLVDEYHLILSPLALGGRKPLFMDLKERHRLKLIKKTFKSVKSCFIPARNGMFE